MIAVDTSALVRVFLREPGYEVYQRAIFEARTVHLPLSCIVEFASLMRLGEHRIAWLDLFMSRETTLVVGNDPEHRELALEAVLKFGKGSGHPARLNFGDCLVYAVAKFRNLPLLFVGDDFPHTDLVPAIPVETRT